MSDCAQCGLPMLGFEQVVDVEVRCPDCGEVEHSGLVHVSVCFMDMMHREPQVRSQMRRAGLVGLN